MSAQTILNLKKSEHGASTMEVTLIVALTVVVSISSINLLGSNVDRSVQLAGSAMCGVSVAAKKKRPGATQKQKEKTRSCKPKRK